MENGDIFIPLDSGKQMEQNQDYSMYLVYFGPVYVIVYVIVSTIPMFLHDSDSSDSGSFHDVKLSAIL